MKNNDFKFRAWDTSYRKMIYSGINGNHKLAIGLDGTIYGFEYNEKYIGEIVSEIGEYPSRFAIMRCTDIIDKNQQTVYEDDIVKTHSGLLGRITFGSYTDDELDSYSYGWYWSGKDEDNQPYFLSFDPEWGGHEIVGNFYENPTFISA